MSWKLMLPPQILAGQVNPVVLSAPTVVCQQLAGTFKAVAPSKPELNRSFAEPGAGAGGATVTGGTTGAGAGAGAGGATVTGGTTGAGAGAGAGGATVTGGTTGAGVGAGAGGATVTGGTTGAGAGAGEGAAAGGVGTAAVVVGVGEAAVAGGVVTVAVGVPEGEVPPLLAAFVRPVMDVAPPADVPPPPNVPPPADVPPPAAPPLNAPSLAGAVPADVDLPLSTRAARPPGVEVRPAAVLLLRFSVWPGTLSILTSRAPSPGGVS